MGEIGFPRREFLHDLRWWEVRSIIRGYRRRTRPLWETARLTAYSAAHCMGGKNIPTMQEWLKFPWERPAYDLPTDDEIAELQAEMQAWNQQHQPTQNEGQESAPKPNPHLG